MQYVYQSCYAMDKRCYEELLLTEDILMEHAALGMAEHIFDTFPKYEVGDRVEDAKTVLIVAGPGNNGADGIALARLLFGFYKVKLYVPFGVKSEMAKKQFARIKNLNIAVVEKIEPADMIVDALFGAGLSRELNEKTRTLLIEMKMQNAYAIACDIPTGLDVHGNPSPQAFYADVTITMGAYKEALFSDYAKEYVGKIIRVDLGVHYHVYGQGAKHSAKLLEHEDLMLPSRDYIQNTHKGDALFGAGLSRELNEKTRTLLIEMKMQNAYAIACDIPTGLDVHGNPSPQAFYADVTITMGAYKEALFSDYAKEYVGKIIRVDLGVHYHVYGQGAKHSAKLLEHEDLMLPSRDYIQNTHKGSFGHAAIFCGEKEGAGIIAAMAASRFGAGLTTLVVHESITPPPFLMHATEVPKNASALAVGMGLGNHFDAAFLKKEVIDSHTPVILDADAFYSEALLAILEQKTREVVITPHPKEFTVLWEKLTGEKLSVEQVQQQRFEMVRRFNAKYPHVALLLKGANMLIAHKDQLYINPLGSPVLSKGGSGDVLSGLIVSLLAQGNTGLDAAIQGSLALTAAAARFEGASYALLPTDLIDALAGLEQK